MTNNLNPDEWVCLPKELEDWHSDSFANELNDIMKDVSVIEKSDAEIVYQAAQRAAPPHNLIAVDKGEWERLREAAKLEAILADYKDAVGYMEKLLPSGTGSENRADLEVTRILLNYGELRKLKTLIQAAVKAAGGVK